MIWWSKGSKGGCIFWFQSAIALTLSCMGDSDFTVVTIGIPNLDLPHTC